MTGAEVRDLNEEELALKEREISESLVILRLRLRTNQIEGAASLKGLRRDIARIKTIRRERALQGQGQVS